MKQLFYNYCNSNKVKQALLVGENIFKRNPENQETFESYFDYLLELVKVSELENAKTLFQQAANVLTLFSENVDINENTVDLILNREQKLKNVYSLLIERENEQKKIKIREQLVYQNDALDLLEQLLDKIDKCSDEKEFNKFINDLGKIDKTINKESLSSTQERKYVYLTKKSSEIVSLKMKYFEKIKERDYNLKAIESYESVFNMFKNGKVINNHKEVLKGLFVYDASRLYNETLVYYNYVYNYVLGKLSDEDKFLMTKFAIMCERR